jgi:hypothetical protein
MAAAREENTAGAPCTIDEPSVHTGRMGCPRRGHGVPVLHEPAMQNWVIRGGHPADEVELNDRLDINGCADSHDAGADRARIARRSC